MVILKTPAEGMGLVRALMRRSSRAFSASWSAERAYI
jgi:hypothetical protein